MNKTFKLTEIGIIPNDWNPSKIGQIAKIVGGGTPSSFNPRFWNGEVNWFTPTEIGDTKYIDESKRKITLEGLNNCSAKLLPIGTVLLTSRASIGDVSILTKEGCTNQGFQSLIADEGIDKEFLYYVAISIKNQLIKNASGSTFLEISPSKLKAILFPLPPTKAEQTAIATALSDADALITQLEKLIAKKRAIKQGSMQELLRPKEGWVEKKLGDCLSQNPKYGINAAAVSYNESLPTYLRITDITDDCRYSKENIVSVNNRDSSSYFLEEGDIVFARTGASVGKTYLYNPNDGRLVFAGFLIRIKTNPQILNPSYFLYFTQTNTYWNWVCANSMRTGQPGINSKELMELTIAIPPINQQVDIGQMLADMDSEIELLETKLEKYKMIKQGMMQNLLTGKIRLV